jgi:hypothetical protein
MTPTARTVNAWRRFGYLVNVCKRLNRKRGAAEFAFVR